jgi:acyl-CoA thioester hydrolase
MALALSGSPTTAAGAQAAGARHSQLIRVYFEDTDAGGIVYHASWLRFFERCRTDWLRSLGVSQAEFARTHGLGFVVRDLRIEYLRPARLDDLLRIELDLCKLRKASLTLSQRACLAEADAGPTLVSAQVRIAVIEQQSARAVGLPADLIAKIDPPSGHTEEFRVHAK